MVESRGGPRFAEQRASFFLSLPHFLGKKLERDHSLQLDVECLIHHSHSAHAQTIQDAVFADRLSVG